VIPNILILLTKNKARTKKYMKSQNCLVTTSIKQQFELPYVT